MLGPPGFHTLLLLLSAFCLGLGTALPTAARRETSLVLRQNNGGLTQPVTVETQDTLQTSAGPMLESCVITLTPTTGPNGEALVQEMKACNLESVDASVSSVSSSSVAATVSSSASTAATGSSSAGAPTSTIASSAIATSVSESGVVQNGVSTIPASAVSSIAPSSAASSAAASAATSNSASPSSSVSSSASSISSSSAQSASSSASPSSSSAASGSTPTPGANAAGGNPNSVPTTSTSPSGTSQADSTPSSTPAFQIPGKQLSVLPIGLAVFAGISVIALIVVGLVTYERTKYRRAFRQRKLAESGASMGYGGMAQAA